MDEEGYVYLTGRLKEMINRGGEKIAPLEIDDVILTHPKVSVAVAFGVPHEILGETVNCAVVLSDANCDIDAVKREIVDLCVCYNIVSFPSLKYNNTPRSACYTFWFNIFDQS